VAFIASKTPLLLVSKGPQGDETPIFLQDGSGFQQSFLKLEYVKKALGDPADSVISRTSEDIRKKQKILNEQRQKQARYFQQKEDKEKEEKDLRRRIELEEEKNNSLKTIQTQIKQKLKEKKN